MKMFTESAKKKHFADTAKFHFSAAKYESLEYLTKQLPDLLF